MYRVFFTNFAYFAQTEFTSAHNALAYAKEKGFDASIHESVSGNIIASWSMFGGTKFYGGEYDDFS